MTTILVGVRMFAHFHPVERFDRSKDEPPKKENWLHLIMDALDLPICDKCEHQPEFCTCIKTSKERVWDGPFFD